MFFESNYEKCRKDRFENAMYKATNMLTVTNSHASPSACSDKADFYVRISNPLDVGYVEIEGTWYKKGAEAETM